MHRTRFPGLSDGWARLDGAAGTQMVDDAIEEMAAWMRSGHNANHGGAFPAAEKTDALVEQARASVARLLGASAEGVVFGPSMTALTMRFSAAAGRSLQPGDEIVCTRLDHDANVAPWLIAAARAGAEVRFAEPDRETLELPADAVRAVLSPRTRWWRSPRPPMRWGRSPTCRASSPPRTRSARASSSTPSTPRRTA